MPVCTRISVRAGTRPQEAEKKEDIHAVLRLMDILFFAFPEEAWTAAGLCHTVDGLVAVDHFRVLLLLGLDVV